MFSFKACPRCKGDLYHDRDGYGAYTSCVQCGHYLTQAEEAALMFGVLGTPVTADAWAADRVAA